MNRLDKYLLEDLKTYTTSNSFINEIYKFSQYKIRLMLTGPAQQDFEWGGSSVSQVLLLLLFFLGRGGGGGGAGGKASYPGKIRVLVTLRYRKVDLKLTNSVLKRNIFYNLKQQGSANKNGANVPGSTRDYCNFLALAFELAYPII